MSLLIDDDGSPDVQDDIYFEHVTAVHIERMATGYVWMAVYRAGGKRYVVDFFTPRNGKLCWRAEEDW